MSKPFILGAMTVTVADSVATSLKSNPDKKSPAVRILFGGYVVTVVLLVTSDKNEKLADGMALFILLAALFARPESVLVNTVLKVTNNDVSFIGSKPKASLSTAGGSRASQLKANEIQPDLVPLYSQPNLKLDREAAESFAKVEGDYGRTIYLTGAYRSTAQQAVGYSQDPNRFAPPGLSLHEKGLAVDVDTIKQNVNDPKLVKAFTDNGWHRVGRNSRGVDEPWHWSYGVRG